MYIFIILIIIVLLLRYIEYKIKYNKKYNNNYKKNVFFNGSLNLKILTDNELNFYKQLKILTDKYNLIIFTKIRLADIINTNNISDFNKIKSKHIDFVICDNNTKPICFIELDDSTHNNYKNQKNDNIKNNIMYKVGIKIIRFNVKKDYDLKELENRIIYKTENTTNFN